MRGVRLFAAAVLVVLSLIAPVWGFELLRVNENPCDNGARNLSWRPAQARVDASRLDAPFGELAMAAQASWNDPLRGRFSFVSGSAAAGCDLRDGVTSMEFAATVCGGGGFGDALAVTRSSWRSDGTLIDADIVFNSSSFLVTNQSAFRQVAEHELGHVLGLDHSDACGDSGAGTLMRSVLTAPLLDGPQDDDIAGAQFIYGTSGNGEVPQGANGCAVAVPAGGASPAWLGLIAALTWRWRRKLRD